MDVAGKPGGVPKHYAALFVTLAFVALSGCSKHTSYRYVLTVKIATPQGPSYGSTILSTNAISNVAFPGPEAGTAYALLKGDAAAIRLGGGRYIFALISTPRVRGRVEDFSESLIPPGMHFITSADQQPTHRAIARSENTAVLKDKQIPYFAYFDDIRRPGSFHIITWDHIPTIFPGCYLQSARVNITYAQPKDTLSTILPWVEQMNLPTPDMRAPGDLVGLRVDDKSV